MSDTVFCEGCGCVHDTATALLADSRIAISGLESDLRAKRAKISSLEGARARRLNESKHRAEAMEVLRYWRDSCKPKARELDSPDRLECVIARLAGKFAVEDLKKCTDGYAKRPYVVAKGRRSSVGSPGEWQADAELIFRTPKHVERGIALADQPVDSSAVEPVGWERLDWRKVQRANHREIIRILTSHAGKPYHDDYSRTSHTTCPRCGGSLTIFDVTLTSGGDSMLRCTGSGGGDGCGLDEAAFFKALGSGG